MDVVSKAFFKIQLALGSYLEGDLGSIPLFVGSFLEVCKIFQLCSQEKFEPPKSPIFARVIQKNGLSI